FVAHSIDCPVRDAITGTRQAAQFLLEVADHVQVTVEVLLKRLRHRIVALRTILTDAGGEVIDGLVATGQFGSFLALALRLLFVPPVRDFIAVIILVGHVWVTVPIHVFFEVVGGTVAVCVGGWFHDGVGPAALQAVQRGGVFLAVLDRGAGVLEAFAAGLVVLAGVVEGDVACGVKFGVPPLVAVVVVLPVAAV